MGWMSRHEVVLDRFMLAFFIVGSFVGIWHALPLVTVIFDEQYFVGGVLRAIEMKSILPLAGDVPYGTITFYLNYALQIPFLFILLAWKGFSLVSLKTYLILHPETAYVVPRFLSAIIMSIFAVVYDRYLRGYGLPLVHRFAVLSVIFGTVIATATLHTGKMWVLSTVLSSASALFTYLALRNHLQGRPEPKYGPIFWGILCAFVSLANFPLSLIFLINIPIFLYLFRHDAVRFQSIVRATCIGTSVLLAAVASNWQNYYAEVSRHIGETSAALQLSGESAHAAPSYVASFFVHVEQVLVAFPLVLAVIVIAIATRSIQNKLLFWISIGYSCMYFSAIAVIKPGITDIGNMLHYIYPLAFFFSGMLTAIDYKKMRYVLWGFCSLQAVIFVYTLYLLSVPTTFNQAATYVDNNLNNEHALIINEVLELSLPLNRETSMLLGPWVCGSKCQYWRSSSQDSDFKPLVVTPYQGVIKGKVNLSAYSRVLLITDTEPAETCISDGPIMTFQSGYSDADFVSIQNNLGNYLSLDFWRLHRLGKNIRIYEISEKCAETIRWKDFEGFSVN